MQIINTTIHHATAALVLAALSTTLARADIQIYQDDPDGWFDAVGSWTTIGFDEVPEFTTVREQYAHLGVHFVDTDMNLTGEDPTIFPRDGFGMLGGFLVDIRFDDPMRAFATHHPGTNRYRFYLGDELLLATPDLGLGGTDVFSGFISDSGFDRVEILPYSFFPDDRLSLDNIYFSTIPAPGALALLALGTVARRRRA